MCVPGRRSITEQTPVASVELQRTGFALDRPSCLMHKRVMVPAEKDQIAQAGLSAVCPAKDVMGVAPMCRSVAAREHTSEVTSF